MTASILDLRRRMADVLKALDHNEPVTVLYRGRERAILVPVRPKRESGPVKDQPAFGM